MKNFKEKITAKKPSSHLLISFQGLSKGIRIPKTACKFWEKEISLEPVYFKLNIHLF